MDTKSEKMRALTCEATLVSLVIEDIFQDKADELTQKADDAGKEIGRASCRERV